MKKSDEKIILGVNGWIERGHDASACLIKNNGIVAFAEEERFSRKKHSYDSLPIMSIAYCLQEGGVSVDDIYKVVYGWDIPKAYEIRGRKFPYSKKQIVQQLFPPHLYTYKHLPILEFMNHHISHAASSFRVSGFDKSSVLVLDGQGEDSSGVLAYAENGNIKIIEKMPISFSLGYMLEAACKHIRMKTSDVGKLMGLAGYGKKYQIFDNVVFSKTGYSIKGFAKDEKLIGSSLDEQEKVIAQWKKYFLSKYPLNTVKKSKCDVSTGFRAVHMKFNRAHKDFALSAQKTLEEIIIHLTKLLIEKTGCRKLSVAGGVGLNCAANGRILSEGIADELFIQPAANDAGVSIGAALETAYRDFDLRFPSLENIYLGPWYANQQIQKTLKQCKIHYAKARNIYKLAARVLADGKIVGWFRGRMEGGPRALGNRSIIANIQTKNVRGIVNKIKSRENWRPLAPSILEEHIKDYFEQDISSRFMLQSHKIKRGKIKEIRAVVHTDFTARYQSVSEKTNKSFHTLIKEFYKITGVPVLLNTSLNINGEPIVCTPEQALAAFYASPMDCLALEDCWITKHEK